MRKLAAIMFTDIAGYTALMSHDEEKALQLLQKNRALLKPIIEEYRGEWLKEIGDGTLSSFASAVDAANSLPLTPILLANAYACQTDSGIITPRVCIFSGYDYFVNIQEKSDGQ